MTDHVKLVANIATMQAEIAELQEAVDFMKSRLAEELPPGENLIGSNDTGWTKVIVYQHKTFNADYGRKQLDPRDWELIAAAAPRVPNSTLVRSMTTPEQYALFQKPSDKLSVKLEVLND